jgi:ElaB/YqjD/DUF883 family membrane-anchored ribosome-binding protein
MKDDVIKDKVAANISAAKAAVSKSGYTYPELQDIRDDLESLKSNVVELTRHLQHDGGDYAREVAKKAKKRMNEMGDTTKDELYRLEDAVRTHPSQSVAVAFLAGALASLLLRGRD